MSSAYLIFKSGCLSWIKWLQASSTLYDLTERCGDIDQTAEGSQCIVFIVETHKTDAECVDAWDIFVKT